MPETMSSSLYDKYGNPMDSTALGNTPLVTAPPLYNSDEKKEDAFSEESLKQFFEAAFTLADEHRQPRKVIWDQCWSIYNNEYDWSQKAWWQHKAPIPKVRASVDKAVALFRKTLLRMYPFYGVQSESRMGRTKGRYTMLLCDYWFDQINIIEALVTAFKVGLITSSSILKIWWQRVEDFKPELYTNQTKELVYEFGIPVSETTKESRDVRLTPFFKGKLGIAPVNPQDFWVVPGTRGRSCFERDSCTLNELESLAEEGVYDKAAIKRLREKLTQSTTKTQDIGYQTGEGRPNCNDYFREVDLWHYWGDIYDKEGKLILCNGSFTFAAERSILIRKPRPNPFYHKRPPYILGTPYTIPFSTYNRGMVEDVMEIARSITEMANLVADGALYDALKSFAVDVDQLDSPEEAKGGLYPGKTWIRHSNNAATPNEQLVQTVDVGHVPTESMNMIGTFERYFQEGSFVNEWVGGQGGKSGRTLGEVNIKTQSALEGLDEAARNLEVTLIEPTVQMAAQIIYQFQQDFMLPRLTDNYPQVSMLLQGMHPAERYATMVGEFAFKVRGLSVMIDRQQRMGELKEILQLLSYLPGFVERLNPDAVLEEVLMPLGWDPRRLLINAGSQQVTTPTAGATQGAPGSPPLQQLLMQGLQQMMAQGGQGGGQGGPESGRRGQPPIQQANAREGRRPQNQAQNPMSRGMTQGLPEMMQKFMMANMARNATR